MDFSSCCYYISYLLAMWTIFWRFCRGQSLPLSIDWRYHYGHGTGCKNCSQGDI